MTNINTALWEPVTNENQITNISIIKIVGIPPKNSYRRISVKKVLHMKNGKDKEWIEILINKKKNYYFNLTAYLNNTPTWGKWVKELYVRKQNE